MNNRTYRRTPAGDRALESERSVPDWFRDILVLVGGQVTSSAICNGIPGHTQEQVLSWIDQLDTLGLVESMISSEASTRDTMPTALNIREADWGEVPFLPAEAAMAITSSWLRP